MRVAFVILLTAMLLSAADFPIDHVTVAGSDVHKLQANLAAIGIPSVYGGAHNNKTTEMALVSLPDGSYLELMGLQPGADPRLVDQHVWAKFLKGDAGPCAWALRAPALAAEVQRLKTAGIEVSAPAASGRERPDGVRLNWETSDIGGDVRGTFFPFLIHDLTPRDLRAFPQGKPGTQDFRKITRIVIAVRDLDAAIRRYRQAFALPAAVQQVDEAFGARIAVFGGAPVVLAQPLAADSWLAGRLEKFGEAPTAFVLGAVRPERYQAASQSHWSSADISWFDAEKLGWRLGLEKAR
ncbi:MAG TPA: VOC family protein [Bryobacteraceae bacterium]|nr:VOC family protein [Bryobacteraceae bacterium]